MRELRLLGTVELRIGDERVDLGPPKQRCVVAALALTPGTPVPIDTLVDRIWDDTPPEKARAALHTYVARLRRLTAGLVVRQPGGYALALLPDQVDACRFRRLVERALRTEDPVRRADQLAEALALWRDDPLAGLTGEWIDAIRVGLRELRLRAVAARADLVLDRDEPPTDIVGELTEVAAAHPLAETIVLRLMTGLHRTGRTGEALLAYDRLRRRLADELGQDPGPELRQLHQQLLTQDAPVPPGVGFGGEPPRQLPAAPAVFVGRDAEYAALLRTLTADRTGPAVAAILGPGGVGKSALALRVAHAVRDQFPDGQLYVDLLGSSPGVHPLAPVEVLGRFLRALGLAGSAVPSDADEAAATFRSLSAGKRILLLLDNAYDTAQLRPLLPAGAGCGVLVTSRTVLTALGDAAQVGLSVLSPDESVALLARLDPSGRVAREPQRVNELVALCGHLPLALRITAARMTSRPDWELRSFVDRLTNEQQRLDQLGHEDLSVRACFQASYQALDQGDAEDRGAAAAFRLLGLPDGPDISLPIAARLLDLPERFAEQALERLVDAQLLESPAPGRYRIHDLIRLYARELAVRDLPEPAQYAALERTWRTYLATAVSAGQLFRPGYRADLVEPDPDRALPLRNRADARAWVAEELPNLIAAARQASRAPGALALLTAKFAHALFAFMHMSGNWSALHQLDERAVQIARAEGDVGTEIAALNDLGVMVWLTGDGDRAVKLFATAVEMCRQARAGRKEARALLNLGNAYNERGRYADAQLLFEQAIVIDRRMGDASGEASVLNGLGQTHRRLGDLYRAASCLNGALRIFRRLNDPVGEAGALRRLAVCLVELGELRTAAKHLERALALGREGEAVSGTVWALAQLAEVHQRLGDCAKAMQVAEEALGISRRVGTQQEQALALMRYGIALADTGAVNRARACWREALPIFERLGAPEAAQVRQLLDTGPPDHVERPEHAGTE